ncbi:hypothetical protein BKA93DRAFT_238019 [Sparassis latifolia]
MVCMLMKALLSCGSRRLHRAGRHIMRLFLGKQFRGRRRDDHRRILRLLWDIKRLQRQVWWACGQVCFYWRNRLRNFWDFLRRGTGHRFLCGRWRRELLRLLQGQLALQCGCAGISIGAYLRLLQWPALDVNNVRMRVANAGNKDAEQLDEHRRLVPFCVFGCAFRLLRHAGHGMCAVR